MPEQIYYRCPWASNPLMVEYHDHEWGIPIHHDQLLFEFLILEGAQAGLSWDTILRKREAYRLAFDQFVPQVVAGYEANKIADLLVNPGIVRNRRKIESAVVNAQAFIAVQESFGSFDAYLWQFVGGKPRQNSWKSLNEVPALTPESQLLSRDLIQRGFKFCGATICYALMQAVGLVNDHLVDCFRYQQV